MTKRRLGAIEMLAACLFLSVAIPDPAALAAPFCVTSQALPPQCIYDDPGLCQRDAAHQGGVCAANADAAIQVEGSAPYCLAVAGGPALCRFYDVRSCVLEARHHRTACITAPVAPATVAPAPPQQPQPLPQPTQRG